MPDTVEMQDIRGLDIDKMVKGFALEEFRFRSLCTESATSGDSIRWYSEANADLTATAPSAIANISPLSTFGTLEVSWTRNTSYCRKYGAEGTISIEDIKSADIDVLSRTLLRLTRSVAKAVDSRIWDVMTESRTPVNINSVTATASWDSASGQDPIEDILEAKQKIAEASYDAEGAVLCLSPKDHKSLLTWLISTKGVNIPGFAVKSLESGQVTSMLGLSIIVSNNVTADYALVVVPQKATTLKIMQDITSRIIEEPGIHNKARVWMICEAYNTDSKAISLISNTQT